MEGRLSELRFPAPGSPSTDGSPALPHAPRQPADGAAARAEPFTELTARRLGPVRRFFATHPAVMDWLVVAWYLVPAALTLAFAVEPPVSGERATVLVIVLLTAAALLWRRRAPVAVLAVTSALLVASCLLTGDTSGADLAAVLALYAVAAYRPAPEAWLSLAGLTLVAGTAFYLWLDPTSGGMVTITEEDPVQVAEISLLQMFLITTVTMLVLSLVALALGMAARGRREHVTSLVERTRQLALERDQREHIAVATERARIAREMHDVVAHSLSVMVALADGASAALERRPEQARAALDELAETGRTALADTRRLVGVLREADGAGGDDGVLSQAPLAPQPGVPEVADLVERFQTAGLPVRLVESGPALPGDAGLQLAVYRIVQESLTNVLRYARLSPGIEVRIERRERCVVVEVVNAAGPTGTTTAGSGQGLIGMRERAAVYNGTVAAGPHDDGWRVRAELRWNGEEER